MLVIEDKGCFVKLKKTKKKRQQRSQQALGHQAFIIHQK